MAEGDQNQNTDVTGGIGGSSSPEMGYHVTGPVRPRKKWFALVVVLLVLAIAGGAAALWMKSRDDTGKKPATTNGQYNKTEGEGTKDDEADAACAASLTNYENTSLGFGFCYPATWGTATVHDTKFDASDIGDRWRIAFSAKEQVSVAVVSSDWSTTIPRDGTCVDPAVVDLPPFAPFSTVWTTETFGGTEVGSATRGIEVLADQYLIQERTDDLLTSGVCLEGYRVINGTYAHVASSFFAEFAAPITSPSQHVATPEVLIPAADRADFAAMVKSIYKL